MSEPGDLTSYGANCHCRAVTFTVKIPSLKDHKVMSCNCSLCTRNGYLMIYPERKNVAFHSGFDSLISYPVLNTNVHKFCSMCGSSIMAERMDDIPAEEVERIAINVRMIKDINVDELKLKFYDGMSSKPEYDIEKSSS